MKLSTKSIIVVAALASLGGCAAPSDSSEHLAQAEQAETGGGISAVITSTAAQGNFQASLTVTNNNDSGSASNWQVSLNLLNGSVVNVSGGGEALNIGGVWTITLGPNGGALQAGQSVQLTLNGVYSGPWAPLAVTAVDGEANGTAGVSLDGVDHIARAAASGALGVALSYENNKLPNNGDPNYPYYDDMLWAAQSYIIADGQIAFDPNAPGYEFVPPQAMAALATVQTDPSVAEYLVAGLQSCFQDTSGKVTYNFNAATLKGFPTTASGSTPGVPVPPNAYRPSFYNPVDLYTIDQQAGPNGEQTITITESSNNDYWFGMLTSGQLSTFGSQGAVLSKFKGGVQTMCSPFNGAGGATPNPYLVVTINRSSVGARQQQVGAQCQNGCTS
ncbi:MAG: cellulose-binding domain-containing protein, partial [Polyangiaceae bacterium]|nr:cellulose-binding domain-containing protein [Polyangiaceae bacterium]